MKRICIIEQRAYIVDWVENFVQILNQMMIEKQKLYLIALNTKKEIHSKIPVTFRLMN